ncbi:MAG: TRAP transporter substrate-binding protein DctP [Oscillospiraceae bacterium]|jgi:TRAP-type C4-dicarboxylate transport system substrate-binding protein
MKKKVFSIVLVLALALSFAVMYGCSSNNTKTPAATPGGAAPTEGPAETAKPAEPAEPEEPEDDTVYTLIVSSHAPAAGAVNKDLKEILDYLTEESNGRLQFDLYTDATLVSPAGIADAITSGVCDMGVVNGGRLEGRLSTSDVVALPAIFDDAYQALSAFDELYKTNATVKKQFDDLGIKPFGYFLSTQFTIVSDKEIKSLADLKGKLVSIPNAIVGDIFTKLGINSMSISNVDAYENLSKHTIDAVASNSLSGNIDFGVNEIAKYCYNMQMGSGMLMFVIGIDAYNNLPADLQQLIDSVTPQAIELVYRNEILNDKSSETYVAGGGTIIEPTAEDVSAFDAYAEEGWNTWAEGLNGTGIDGTGVLKDYQALLAKYKGKAPTA